MSETDQPAPDVASPSSHGPAGEVPAAEWPPVHCGMPAPFYDPAAPREYYRFLFGGVLMLVGCLMPFGPEWEMAGYKTLTGGCCLVIALGIVWSMWGAIGSGGAPPLKWLLAAVVPLLWSGLQTIEAFEAPAVKAFAEGGGVIVGSWSQLWDALLDKGDPERFAKVGNFVRYFGPGKVLVLLGALVVEAYFVRGVVGGLLRSGPQASPRRGRRR